MTTPRQPEDVMREYERTVLDPHHTTFPLWKRDKAVSCYSALAAYDSLVLQDAEIALAPVELGLSQHVKTNDEAVSQAIRWLDPLNTDLTPTADRVVLREASEFCRYAGTYVNIADMHKMYGNQQVSLVVDEDKRLVRFCTPTGHKPGDTVVGFLDTNRAQAAAAARLSSASLAELGEQLFRAMEGVRFSCEGGRIVLTDIDFLNSEALRSLISLIHSPVDVHLAATTDLGGFTVEDFVAYVDSLRRWSLVCLFIYTDRLSPQQWGGDCMPTQVVPRAAFLEHMTRLAGRPLDRIEAITRFLTFDHRTKSPDLFQQPLICGPTTVAWSARLIDRSQHQRNMLRLLARTGKEAATIIGEREKPMIVEFGNHLAKQGGYAYKARTELSYGGKKGELDLLGYNWKVADEVLLVEFKAVLSVDEIVEVKSVTKELQDAQEQLRSVEAILRAMPDSEKSALYKFVKWDRVRNYFKLVVSYDSEPNEHYDHSVIPAIAFMTMLARLRQKHYRSPSKLVEVCRNRRWASKLLDYKERYWPFKVGDVTYELPILSE